MGGKRGRSGPQAGSTGAQQGTAPEATETRRTDGRGTQAPQGRERVLMDYEKAEELALDWWLIADVGTPGGYDPKDGLEVLKGLTAEDFQAIASNPEMFIYALQHCMDVTDAKTRAQIKRNAPKVTGGARGAVARSQAKAVSPEVERVAQLADEAGMPTNASYRTLLGWGRDHDLRKGSDFWRAVVAHRSTTSAPRGTTAAPLGTVPSAPGALRRLRAV